jgi:hypothetical protein
MSSYSCREDQFQILGTPWCVPFGAVSAHRQQCKTNHSQTPERLRERGGLSWCELFAVLSDKPWQKMDGWQAQQLCILMIHDEQGKTWK